MKKIVFFAAVAALAAVSCVKDGYTSDVQTTVVKATVSETKTALVNNTKTYWTKDDQISVFNAGKGNCQFTTAIEEASANAEFTFAGDWAAPEVYHAFYPYSASIATEDFTTFTGLEIPAVQTAVADGFDPEAALLYGEGASANLLFSNLTALIKFTVASDEVYTVKLVSTGDKLAGEASLVGDKLTATSSEVVLKGSMLEGKTFYVAVAPGTFETLKVFVNGVELTTKAYTARTLEAGTIYNMGEITNPRTTAIVGTLDQVTNFETTISTSDIPWYNADNIELIAAFTNDTFWHHDGYRVYNVGNDGKTIVSGDASLVIDDDATWGNNTTNEQHYAVLYGKYDPPCYFNIDWESDYDGQAGVYPIVDVQDRRGNHNTLVCNASYYNSNTNELVFDAVFHEGGKTKFLTAKLHRN